MEKDKACCSNVANRLEKLVKILNTTEKHCILMVAVTKSHDSVEMKHSNQSTL